MILARGSDDPCGCSALARGSADTAIWAWMTNAVRGGHDLAIALSKLGFSLVSNLVSGLNVTSLLLVVIIGMNDAIGTTYCQRGNSYLRCCSKESQGGRIKGSFAFLLLVLVCVCSGSMVVAWMLSSLISTALVSTVAPRAPSHT